MPSPTTASPSAVPSAAAPETPLFFEHAGRPLYGVYHAPAAGRPDAPLMVSCHSLGVEQLTIYRNDVLCARAAAAAGFPVFRYHARGHGDSSGDFAGVHFEGLVEDAIAAAGEGLRRSGARGVVWLGVRFGSESGSSVVQETGSPAPASAPATTTLPVPLPAGGIPVKPVPANPAPATPPAGGAAPAAPAQTPPAPPK